jgi:hypothetical protein
MLLPLVDPIDKIIWPQWLREIKALAVITTHIA